LGLQILHHAGQIMAWHSKSGRPGIEEEENLDTYQKEETTPEGGDEMIVRVRKVLLNDDALGIEIKRTEVGEGNPPPITEQNYCQLKDNNLLKGLRFGRIHPGSIRTLIMK